MFTIIGGDGKEYGPVTVEQVRAWIAAGRANLDTKVKAVGTEDWRRAGDFAEFGGGAGLPPVIPVAGTVVSAVPVAAMGAPTVPIAPAVAAQPLAGLGERFAAALIDGFIEMLCWLPTSLSIMQAMREQITSGAPDVGSMMAAMNGSVAKSLPYLGALAVIQCVLLSVRSQSIGKAILGLRIVRHKTGEPGGFLHAFLLRGLVTWVLCQIPLLGSLFKLVDICFIFGDERRCVHDFIGGTKVVKAGLVARRV